MPAASSGSDQAAVMMRCAAAFREPLKVAPVPKRAKAIARLLAVIAQLGTAHPSMPQTSDVSVAPDTSSSTDRIRRCTG